MASPTVDRIVLAAAIAGPIMAAILRVLAQPAGAQGIHGSPACEARAEGRDRREIRCALKATDVVQRLRFQADFSGSHDDTFAALAAALDGVSLKCDAGSKTLLSGEEEGDVRLDCRFALAAQPDAERILQVKLTWSHAQFEGFSLLPD